VSADRFLIVEGDIAFTRVYDYNAVGGLRRAKIMMPGNGPGPDGV
jgi:hypothetical protein